jgi:hypothetical protein
VTPQCNGSHTQARFAAERRVVQAPLLPTHASLRRLGVTALPRDSARRDLTRTTPGTQRQGLGAVMWDGGVLRGVCGSTALYAAEATDRPRRRAPVPAAAGRAAEGQQLNRTSPHKPTRTDRAALLQYPATQGFLVGVVLGVSRWHARGQGFKSPQLHPRSTAICRPGQHRFVGAAQQIRSKVSPSRSLLQGGGDLGRPSRDASRPRTGSCPAAAGR